MNRIHTSLIVRLAWYLIVGLRDAFCVHRFSIVDDTCTFCGMSHNLVSDFRWKRFPKMLVWRIR